MRAYEVILWNDGVGLSSQSIYNIYNGEFDPGSGRTLAAGLTHASRRRRGELALPGDWRTGE